MYVGMLMTGIEHWLLPKLGVQGPPWTMHRTEADHDALLPASECHQDQYPKPDGKITFDRLSRCSSPTPTTPNTSRRT
jgi:electron-transferring-flavoprotein dehydrogenase